MHSKRVNIVIAKTFTYILALILAFLAVFPLYWLISTSLRTGRDVYSSNLLPASVSFDSYIFVLTHSPFLIWFKNSVIISLCAMCVSVMISSLAAYSMSRYVTWWKKYLSKGILMAYMFPSVLLILPIFTLYVKVGLLDSRVGLMISYSLSNLPFAMWLLTAYFETIPKELDEAAKIDGASNNYTFWRVIFPVAAPGLATSAIFIFINAWNEFEMAVNLISTDAKRTLPIGLYTQMGGKAGELVLWNDRMAMSALVIVPMLIVFAVLGKYITKGLTAGALKG